MPDLKNPAFVALLLGVAFGGVIGCLAASRLVGRMARSSWSPQIVRRTALALMVIGAAPSGLSAFIVGGNLALLFNSLVGNTAIGESIAIGLGIAVVLAGALALLAALGGGIGVAVASAASPAGDTQGGSVRLPRGAQALLIDRSAGETESV